MWHRKNNFHKNFIHCKYQMTAKFQITKSKLGDCLFSNMCALLYFYIFFCVFDTGSLWNCWTMNEIFLEIIFPIKSHYIPLTEIQGATSHQSMFRPHQPHCARHEIPFFLFSFLSKTYLYNKINKSTQLWGYVLSKAHWLW